MIETNNSLLEQIRSLDNEMAWQSFYEIYWQPIVRYAMKLGLSYDEAQDVLQETMVDFIRVLPRFHYNRSRGRFRNYLLTIVHRKSMNALRLKGNTLAAMLPGGDVGRNGSPEPSTSWKSLHAESLSETELQQWKESVTESALDWLRHHPGIEPQTMVIFEAVAVEGKPVAEIAKAHGVTENNVYQIKNRMIRRLRKRVGLLFDDPGESDFLPNGENSSSLEFFH